MLSSLSKQQTTVEQSQKDSVTPPEEQPIEEIIAQILFEREYEKDDSEDESEDEEDSAARNFIERSFLYLSKTSLVQK